jgi:aminopeptidase-like protein
MSIYEESERFFSTLFDELFPILRSITGPGLRKSYNIFNRYMPLKVDSISSGSSVFDWTVPQEWHCEEAYLLDPDGEVIADMKRLNLEVVNYSEPVERSIDLDELQSHLYSLPELPDAIPYVTSYYQKRWGFCISQNVRDKLRPGIYKAVIKSQFYDGNLDIAQTTLEGSCKKEVLLSSYLCHPSMANNELSGPLVLLGLYHRIKSWPKRRYTYRFALHPETIGSLALLHLNGEHFKKNLVSGLVINCMGGEPEELTFKHSRNDEGALDKLLYHLNDHGFLHSNIPFSPLSGSDERQYNSPGFQLPVCCVSRSFHSGFKGYHTSLDTKESMGIKQVVDSIDKLEKIFLAYEQVAKFENKSSHGEPNLGKRGLYPTLSFFNKERVSQVAELDRIKMLLCYSDGAMNTIDIANKHGQCISDFAHAIDKLEKNKLLDMV